MDNFFQTAGTKYQIKRAELSISFGVIDSESYNTWDIYISAEGQNSVNYSGRSSYLEFQAPQEISCREYEPTDGFELSVQYVALTKVGMAKIDRYKFSFGEWDPHLLKIPLVLSGESDYNSFEVHCKLDFTGYYFYGYTDEMISQKLKELNITHFDRTVETLPNDQKRVRIALKKQEFNEGIKR